ncbi:MAG: hypothetical protein RLZZ303_2265, partial [Candidatus Hydrogenedentota bacterium]
MEYQTMRIMTALLLLLFAPLSFGASYPEPLPIGSAAPPFSLPGADG